jgi:DNA processing protein
MEPTETLATLRLLISGLVTNARLGRLLSDEQLRAVDLPSVSHEALLDSGFSRADATEIQKIAAGHCAERLSNAAKGIYAATLGAGAKPITLADPTYPILLKQIYDPPALLFVKGRVKLLGDLCLAMVGSRKASTQAKRFTRWLAAELAGQGFTVVSGLARGVDCNAHSGALETGHTIAVIGTGIDVYYPKENQALQRQLENEALVITEFFPGAPPRAAQFPQRNRLISGLSLGTVVVEATKRSGSLITARFAAEQGREVFAVPGQVDRVQSRGAHQLLRDGATLVESADDVIAGLPISGLIKLHESARPDVSSKLSHPDNTRTSKLEQSLLRRIAAFENLPQDLMRSENLTPGELSSALLKLELAGKVENRDGRIHLRD